MKKLTKKEIPANFWECLKVEGHVVPRVGGTNADGGNVIPFMVGKNYIIVNAETKEELIARCTQDTPHHLRLIEIDMKLMATENGYNYWKGVDEKGNEFYNVVPIDQSKPLSGYYAAEFICGIKKVPNLFK